MIHEGARFGVIRFNPDIPFLSLRPIADPTAVNLRGIPSFFAFALPDWRFSFFSSSLRPPPSFCFPTLSASTLLPISDPLTWHVVQILNESDLEFGEHQFDDEAG